MFVKILRITFCLSFMLLSKVFSDRIVSENTNSLSGEFLTRFVLFSFIFRFFYCFQLKTCLCKKKKDSLNLCLTSFNLIQIFLTFTFLSEDINGRMLFTSSNQWSPVGKDVMKDPTFDYIPPVLEQVRYWGDGSANKNKNDGAGHGHFNKQFSVKAKRNYAVKPFRNPQIVRLLENLLRSISFKTKFFSIPTGWLLQNGADLNSQWDGKYRQQFIMNHVLKIHFLKFNIQSPQQLEQLQVNHHFSYQRFHNMIEHRSMVKNIKNLLHQILNFV